MMHHGDALEFVRGLADASVDAVVTDPPYCSGGLTEAARRAGIGQGLRSENLRRDGWFGGDNMGTAGLAWALRTLAVECVRVVKPTGSVLIFCDWRMLTALQPAVESAGLRYQNLIVWDKGAIGLGTGFRPRHELIMHFTNGSPAYYDKAGSNVLAASRVRGDAREHQTQKPVDLLRSLIRVVAPPGGLVLDPFAGSGSTGVAAVEEGREFVGVEREAAYVETARRRLAAASDAQALRFLA